MAGKKKKPQTFKSPRYTTAPFVAVFPKLNTPDEEYGGYSVLKDVLGDPDFEKLVKKQAEDTIKAGRKKFGVKQKPTNDLFKDGEYKDGDGKTQPTRRVTFKMADHRKIDNEEIPQKPRVVDAEMNPVTEEIWGGSEIKVGYHLQYSLTPTGCFITLKLDAVQVLKLVGPGGEVDLDDLFEVEEGGFVSKGSDPTETDKEEEEEQEEPSGSAKSGRDF